LEVSVMHVLRRPHLPHAIGVSIAAALLAIVITLLLASTLSDATGPAGGASTLARHHAPATIAVQRTVPAPRWPSDPLASPLSRPLPQPWGIAPR
jgi:hypothetical protein